jgi:hypothetical protein
MDENQAKQGNMVEASDCLEAVGVFRAWKNFLFVIAVICLILLQVSFWVVDTGMIKNADRAGSTDTIPSKVTPPATTPSDTKGLVVPLEENEVESSAEETNKIEETAQKIVGTKSTNEEGKQIKQDGSSLSIKIQYIELAINVCNYVLLVAVGLYCLTMLFSLKISLVGRLGGINHISRAFFLSLIFVFLLMPWQKIFGHILVGAVYTPEELLRWCCDKNDSIFKMILHYLRFSGYWLLVILLLVLAQIRSSRWTKAILRRLEIM